MSKKIAILQSNYIPWKGYFDMIAAVDEFIIYDDMQYTKNDWRNRNKIKTKQGLLWLTVPVLSSGKFGQSIRNTQIKPDIWERKHWKTLCENYSKAKNFKEVAEIFEPLYLDNRFENLSEMNIVFIKTICSYLNIKTTISYSWDYDIRGEKTERLVSLCKQACASEYISGPSARDYIQSELFEQEKIQLTWFDYKDYAEYPQLGTGFEHGVSILDLLFNCGKESPRYMRYVKQ